MEADGLAFDVSTAQGESSGSPSGELDTGRTHKAKRYSSTIVMGVSMFGYIVFGGQRKRADELRVASAGVVRAHWYSVEPSNR
eukprot:1182999-Prorocentrum_minimum.AAC.2